MSFDDSCKGILILSLIFLSTAVLTAGSLPADGEVKAGGAESKFDLDSYLARAIDRSRAIEDRRLLVDKNRVELEKREAEQEVDPSPLLLRSEKLELDLSQQRLKRTIEEKISKYLRDFLEYLELKELFELHEEYVELFQAELNRIEDMYREGKVTSADVLQAEVELRAAENNLKKTLNELENQEFVLAKNLQLRAEEELEIQHSKKAFPELKITKEFSELLEAARDNRLEIEESRAERELAKIDLQLAESSYRPDLEEEVAEVECRKTKNEVGRTVDEIEVEVSSAYARAKNTKEDVLTVEKQIESQEEMVRINSLFLEEEYITGIEFLDTQVDLYEREIDEISSRIESLMAAVELYLATGELKEMFDHE